MFSGITQTVARISAISEGNGSRRFTLEFPPGFCRGLQQGASVAVDGVCLTVSAEPGPTHAQFDVILPTLQASTLSGCVVGDVLNVERALAEGAEIGGHILSGHVDGQLTLLESQPVGDNLRLRLAIPAGMQRYLFAKGYVALNGVSLTIAAIDKRAGWFEVWLIPETRHATTLGRKSPGSRLNLEIERQTQVLVDTVRESLEEKLEALLELLGPALTAPRRSQWVLPASI